MINLGQVFHCMTIIEKFCMYQVFRLVSLWFSLSSRQSVVKAMLSTVKEVCIMAFLMFISFHQAYYDICKCCILNKDHFFDINALINYIIDYLIIFWLCMGDIFKFTNSLIKKWMLSLQVQSFKFIPLVYQIASRLSSPKNSQGSNSFQVCSP